MEAAWLVTGAASGIGRSLATQLAARGEKLVLWDRDQAGLSQTAQSIGSACVFQTHLDVTDPQAVREAAEQTDRKTPLRFAIHCAGILRVGSALEMAPADYRSMMEVNYLGSVHVAQALVPILLKSATPKQRALLVLISSVAGLRAIPSLTGYSASKHAVVGFGRGLSDELYEQPIDVRVVCPPAVDTPMVRNLPSLPPVYRLSPPQSVDGVAASILRGIREPGWLTLLDAQSKLLWGLERTIPKTLGWVVQRMAR